MIKLNEPATWFETFDAAVGDRLAPGARTVLGQSSLEYPQDALEVALQHAPHGGLLCDATEYIRGTTVAGYHGTRASDEEAASIHDRGLLLLREEDRVPRLVRALSKHAKWSEKAQDLWAAIDRHGAKSKMAQRVRQIHLAATSADAMRFARDGSEFDEFVAHDLLGDEGAALIKQDGAPRLVIVELPGAVALDAANPFIPVDDALSRGDIPYLVRQLLTAWAYCVARPDAVANLSMAGCAMMLRTPIPPGWIKEVRLLT